MRLFRWIFVVSLLLVSSGVRAQTRLTRNGKPAARIVVAQQTAADLTAAQLLQRFVRESTGATLPLLHDVTPRSSSSWPMRYRFSGLPPSVIERI